MRFGACLIFLFLCFPAFFLSAKEKSSSKKTTSETVTITGPVTKLKSQITALYRIGETTVARGAERHLKKCIGKDVSAACVVKDGRIIRIKSVSVLGDTPDPVDTGKIAFRHLKLLYNDDPGKTIKKFRGVDMEVSGTATSIKNYSKDEYQINLDKSRGKVIIPKNDVTIDLKKKLFDLMKKKSEKVNISFYGKWKSTEVDSLVFKEVSSVSEQASGKPAKKGKKSKKKKKK